MPGEDFLAKVCLAATLGMVPAAAPGQVNETVLQTFTYLPKGANPYAAVTVDAAGNFYGTTFQGGDAGWVGLVLRLGWGTVYKIDSTGHQTVLHTFTGGKDGGSPYSGVILDAAGNLYGTTEVGGASGYGAVYKIDTMGQETVLYNFTDGADGGKPYGGLIFDAAGNLVGTASEGGNGNGVVYKVDPTGTETVLYSFTGKDGSRPWAGVTMDAAGNLYGTTYAGGTSRYGVVYKLDTAGKYTVLYNFTGQSDGGNPYGGVVLDAADNLYGTTYGGGSAGGSNGSGVVFKLDSTGKESVLHTFGQTAGDGTRPYAGVIRRATGELYGTTTLGGSFGKGAVYKVGAASVETVLYSFTGGADGNTPYSGVILDASGNLYGTTYLGGAAKLGALYKVSASGKETVLHSFPGSAAGTAPQSGVVLDAAGNVYGTTPQGGRANAGLVYKVDATGHETVLYSFTGGADGGTPYAGVVRDSAGNLYGTAAAGGGGSCYGGCGVVYKLDATGKETVLYRFTGGADGRYPNAGVILDAAGNLYGTTIFGGAYDEGAVYKVDAAGHESVLYSFQLGADGWYPESGLTLDAAGNLYGTTEMGGTGSCSGGCGVVYKLDATGKETVLYSFMGGADGWLPVSGVTLDAAGNLYGTTNLGGPANVGVVYKVDPTGLETVLYSFTGGTDGGFPSSGVILGANGSLIGTASQGGVPDTACGVKFLGVPAGCGVVYEVDTTGLETVLFGFTPGAGGYGPSGGVTRDATGNLYGTTVAGGNKRAGVVFKLAHTSRTGGLKAQ